VSSVSTDDIVLKDMYGIANLGGTTHNRRCADLFQVGDYIGVLDNASLGLETGGIQAVTAVTRSTNTIAAGASGVTDIEANDLIVYANSLENTTVAGTEKNLAPIGILDQMTSTSVHSVSGSTYAKWNAYAAATSGRFTGITLRKMKQNIANEGGGEMDTVWWANGVENDVTAQYMAGVRYTSPFNMEIDGQPSSRGVKFNTSRRVPDGYVFGWDKAKSTKKITVMPDPDAPDWGEGDKLVDQSGKVFSIDYLYAQCTVNRAAMAYASGQTQV
jgi:hypothetical protein